MADAFPRPAAVSRRSFTAAAAATLSTAMVHSSLAAANAGSRIIDPSGKKVWEMKGSIADAYKQEHNELVESIRAGKPIVELRQLADSSLVAVMGRMAAYTGQKVTWKFVAEESKLDLFPKDLTWTSSLPRQAPAVPGKTKLV